MGYQVLARKWRPNSFSELVGQEHVVAAISNALDNNRLHHAYLFTGTRGVGKTTIARIFAKSLNCDEGMSSKPCGQCSTCKEIEQGNFVDLLEIDAASRTKVEDTRDLLDNVQYKPTRGTYKVYLIDEVHMLSKHSFNALLKTLEEPPPHVKFLLATTDPQKLPITILSRCLQFTLKALTREQILQQLQYILQQEHIVNEPAGLQEIARAAQGSMRDALSLTDQAIAQGNGQVTARVVADMLGLLDRNVVLKLLNAILKRDKSGTMQLVEDLSLQAPDYSQILSELMSYLHQIALTQFVPEACKLETHAARAVFSLAKAVPPEHVQLLYQIALQGRKDLPFSVESRVGLEMTLLRMLAFTPENIKLDSESIRHLVAEAPASEVSFSENSIPEASNSEAESLETDLPETASPEAELSESIPLVANGFSVEPTVETEEPLPLAADPSDSESTEKQAISPVSETSIDDDIEQQNIEALNAEQDSLLQQADVMKLAEVPDAPDMPGVPATSIEPELVPMDIAPLEESVNASLEPEPEPEPESGAEHGFLQTEELLALRTQITQTISESDEDENKDDTSAFDVERFVRSEPVSAEPSIDDTSTAEAGIGEPQGFQSGHSAEQLPTLIEPPSGHYAEQVPLQQEETQLPDSLDLLEPMAEYQSFSSETDIDQPYGSSVSPEINASSGEDKKKPSEIGIEAATELSAQENDTSGDLAGVEEVVDFDIPYRLSDGKKVERAAQLDTWSQLIEEMGLPGLTKQVAIHSMYKKNAEQVELTLAEDKSHLLSPSTQASLKESLCKALQQDVNVEIKLGDVTDTPYAVQQAVNKMRMQHAHQVIAQDPEVQRLCAEFDARIINDSIKPR